MLRGVVSGERSRADEDGHELLLERMTGKASATGADWGRQAPPDP